jgi:hypothetical protein
MTMDELHEQNRVVVFMEFGSRVYGTALPSSDTDYKGIMLPSPEEILLCNPSSTFSQKTNGSGTGQRNGASDVDLELYSLYRFLELLCEGQTVALDMLFCPPGQIRSQTRLWDEIVRHKELLLNKRCSAAIGYARSQAEKYSLRGDRISALQAVLKVLEDAYLFAPRALLGERVDRGAFDGLPEKQRQFIRFTSEEAPHLPAGQIDYLEVCGKKAGFTSSVKFAYELFEKQVRAYGDRAQRAQSEGADWKAMYHALRIAAQTTELLETGNITFPRPEAEFLLKVRKGELPVPMVSELIEQGIENIRAAQERSPLRDEPDLDFMRGVVMGVHFDIVTKGHSSLCVG